MAVLAVASCVLRVSRVAVGVAACRKLVVAPATARRRRPPRAPQTHLTLRAREQVPLGHFHPEMARPRARTPKGGVGRAPRRTALLYTHHRHSTEPTVTHAAAVARIRRPSQPYKTPETDLICNLDLSKMQKANRRWRSVDRSKKARSIPSSAPAWSALATRCRWSTKSHAPREDEEIRRAPR